MLQEKYRKRVRIIIYDSESLLSEIGFEYTRQQYYRINCFSQLIRRLKLEIKTWAILPIHLRKDLKSMANYYRALKNLNIHFIESKASLAEGVEKVLEFLGQNTTLNESVADIIIKSLKSAPLGANYLHPMYKGLLVRKFTKLTLPASMQDFIDRVCPVDQLDALALYQKNLREFDRIGRIANGDVIRYWTLAGQHYDGLAELALEYASIPAIMPKLNVEKLSTVSKKWAKNSEINAYALTLIANDNYF